MIAAVVRGNVDEVKFWLRDGGDINVVEGKWGTTPLMAACAPSERISVLKYLLNSIPKVDKEARNARGMTALHQAAWYGQAEAVRLLLLGGADPCSKTLEGMTARGIATAMGHSSVEAVFREADAGTGSKETPDELRARIRTQQRRRNADQLRVLEARLGLPREPLPSCAPHHPPPFVDNRRPAAAAAAAAAEGTQGSATPARRPGPKQAGGTESAMELMPCYRRPSDARRGEMAAREGSGAGGGGGVRPPGAGVPEKVRPVKARPASPAMSDDDGDGNGHAGYGLFLTQPRPDLRENK